MAVDDAILSLARGALSFPVDSKAQFVDTLERVGIVRFRGVDYDARSAADLMPDFFFPIASEEDFLAKVHDLLVSRGFEPVPGREWAASSADPAPDLTRADPAAVVEYVASRLAVGQVPPLPDEDWVDAVDYVTHAVEYARPPQALSVWRSTVLDGDLTPPARDALWSLVRFVRTAAVEGRWEVASEICDCMGDLVDPALAPQRIGGIR